MSLVDSIETDGYLFMESAQFSKIGTDVHKLLNEIDA